MYYVTKIPFRSASGKPSIAHLGEVVEEDGILFLQLAAAELNHAFETEEYGTEVPASAQFNHSWTRLSGDYIEWLVP